MELRTFLAVGELVQAAAHLHGITGPVMFTVSRPTEPDWCANCGDCWMCRDEGSFDTDAPEPIKNQPVKHEDFFYEQHSF